MLLKYHVDVDVLKDVQARDGHLGTELDRIKMAMIEYSTHIYDNAYTQEQMIAFGEAVLKRFNELALHERSWVKNEREAFPKGSDGTQESWYAGYGLGILKAGKILQQTLLNIDISKLLKK